MTRFRIKSRLNLPLFLAAFAVALVFDAINAFWIAR